jgi:hypothetical protein
MRVAAIRSCAKQIAPTVTNDAAGCLTAGKRIGRFPKYLEGPTRFSPNGQDFPDSRREFAATPGAVDIALRINRQI